MRARAKEGPTWHDRSRYRHHRDNYAFRRIVENNDNTYLKN